METETSTTPPVDERERKAQEEPGASDLRAFTWGAVGLGIVFLAVLGGLIAHARLAERAVEGPDRVRVLAPFRLIERSGREVVRDEFQGKYLVVNFVFTSCSLPCLEVNRQMADVQRRLADAADVQLVSITIDPRTDTPAYLAQFAERFGADPKRWLFLTGDKSAVFGLLETSFLSKAAPDLASLLPGGFDRSDRIALVDPKGQLWRYVDGLKPGAADAVVEAIREHRARSSR
ncbi:MAG: SCO family protein [Verrucomicrobiales bacterium]|nr:SCO family protein [Verrucomicrobiales bacterium]